MLKAFLQKPTADELLFAFKCFLAASLALYIALRLGLPRPFWAPMATCIIAQSMSAGSVFVRASSRLIGTLVGTVVSVLLLVSFINYTFLLCFLIALWVGICMYFSMLKRTTDSYVFVVGGFTVPVIIYGIIGDVNAINIQYIMDMAIARAEETGIGFMSAILIHSTVFPKTIGPAAIKRMDTVWKDICQWIGLILRGEPSATHSPQLNAAQIITDLRLQSANLPFDSSSERWAVANIRLLQDRLTVMIPVISSIENSIAALKKADKLPGYWEYLLDNIAVWVQQDKNTPQSAQWLRERIRHGLPKITPRSTWDEVALIHLASDLGKLISYCESRADQRRAIDECIKGHATRAPKAVPVPLATLHKDRRLALLISASAVFTITAVSLMWVISGWNAGFCAPMMTSIFFLSFVRNDNSIAALKKVLLFTIYSLPPAGVYLLIVMYSAHSFEMLMLLLAPCIIIAGIYMARPSTGLGATIFMMGVWSTTTMYDLDMANATSFMNGQVFAQCFGVLMALVFARIFRSFDAEWTTRRLLNSIAEEIARLAQSVKSPPVIQTTVRMIDRISILAPRLSGLGTEKESVISRLFRELRIGTNIVYLMHMRSRLERNGIDIQPLLQTLSAHFAKSAHETGGQHTVLEQIDRTLQKVCHMSSPIRQNAAIAALTGIRRDLFPEASPYYPQTLIPKEIV